jgi:hypothetical protein
LGSSVARAREAKLSMMRFTQSICLPRHQLIHDERNPEHSDATGASQARAARPRAPAAAIP